MTSTPFSSVSWGDEAITPNKLNQMANNDNWLYDNTPRMYYNAWGIRRNSGLVVAGGVARVGATKAAYSHVNVNFGTYFASGSKPIITTGVMTGPQGRLSIIVRGPTGGATTTDGPDHTGFSIWVYPNNIVAASNYIQQDVYINWISMGLSA